MLAPRGLYRTFVSFLESDLTVETKVKPDSRKDTHFRLSYEIRPQTHPLRRDDDRHQWHHRIGNLHQPLHRRTDGQDAVSDSRGLGGGRIDRPGRSIRLCRTEHGDAESR